ncbi:WD repeat-containing protein 18-like [Centruroides sculpturatus]|uniref:WD repeat-containing protein 18-like n=1 Tax=Centruroides sculpturatus TaxID=218467 RepID=UPI000C6E4EEC|nr:WD repeat-containing protein 18-like [Centruroides sculpturatus]
MENALTVVTMDAAEYFIFLGAINGNIYQINLFSFIKNGEMHLEKEEEENIFKGHRKQVTCLSVSLDGQILLSGSDDETARLWSIQSKQCIRIFEHKGPVTNALLIRAPSNYAKSRLPVSAFQRQLYKLNEEMEENQTQRRKTVVQIKKHEPSEVIKENEIYFPECRDFRTRSDIQSKEEVIKENKKLLEMNRQLYLYSIDTIIYFKHLIICVCG